MVSVPQGNDLAKANLKPRLRMMILYYFANSQDYLVAGTGNKSELCVGYFTKYGDGGVDILPLGGLLKTEVRKLAKELGIPKEIIDRTPSAGLWKDQTDEGEMGMSYEDLDFCLEAIEKGEENLIKKEILEIPKKYCIGTHPTALPFNRGRHPLHWLIAIGIPKTALSFFATNLSSPCSRLCTYILRMFSGST